MHLMRPEIVFHMAAQSLVRRAHQDPVETYDVNVVGTVKVLEEIRRCRSVRATVVVTSDKVYKNDNRGRAFTETDALGGDEPYGASKAAAEFAVAAFRKSLAANRRLKVATARAGNVFGGGDWAEDRLVPDAMRAFAGGLPLILRNSGSTRPWQYVLDPLCGYLLLAERLFAGDDDAASAWNFGPDEAVGTPVSDVADLLVEYWNDTGAGDASWESAQERAAPYEARTLGVDSTKARTHLAWQPRISLEDGLAVTVTWHRAQLDGADMATAAAVALDAYLAP
jgi:CDP-glucose 4,6-dehydratase